MDDFFSKEEQQHNKGDLSDFNISGHQFYPQLSKESSDYLLSLISRGSDFSNGIQAVIPERAVLSAFGINLKELVLLSDRTGKELESYDVHSTPLIKELLNTAARNIDIITEKTIDALRRYKNEHPDQQMFDEKNNIGYFDLAELTASVFAYKLSFFISREDISHQTNIANAHQALTMPLADQDRVYLNILANYILKNRKITENSNPKLCTTLSPHLLRSIMVKINEICLEELRDVTRHFSSIQDGYDIKMSWMVPKSLKKETKDIQNSLEAAFVSLKKLLIDFGGDLNFSVDASNVSVTLTCPAATSDTSGSSNFAPLTAGYIRIE